MTTPRQRSPACRRPRGRRWLALWLLAVACVNLVPRQGWDAASGPVVPHDTFPADCSLCHVGPGWHTLREDFAYDHEKQTGVALEGAHERAGCLLCHNDRGPVQRYASRGCGGCHDDPHRTQLGSNCGDCHDERTWAPREAIARHDATRFPLVGAHAAVACFRCHPGAQVGNFAGAPAECRECHAADYDATAAPAHASSGFGRDCESCHLPVAWQPARFDHPATLPLDNAHRLACSACHTTPDFAGLQPDCVACHLVEYQNTTDPPHVAFQFPQQCEQCHEPTRWPDDGFDHAFPIRGGDHGGLGCFECHDDPVDRTRFSCINCHEHRQSEMADEHDEVGGYSWASAACYSCHPTGRE